MRQHIRPFNHVQAPGADGSELVIYVLLGIYVVWNRVIPFVVSRLPFQYLVRVLPCGLELEASD